MYWFRHLRSAIILTGASARSQVATPRGLLRITGAFPLARLLIAPIIPKFLNRHPEIKVDLVLTDKHVDLVADGVDVAVRAQQLPDSNLVARKLFDNPMYLLASPSYLERSGTPREPDDLPDHNCLIYSSSSSVNVWKFNRKGHDYSVSVSGSLQCDNGDSLLEAAISGLGLLVLPYWMVHKQLASGELVEVMPEFEPAPLPIHFVYPERRQRGPISWSCRALCSSSAATIAPGPKRRPRCFPAHR
jgi:DNA-binding transcriptional LysR family regulator